MKHSRQQLLKFLTIGLAIALAIGSLMFGGAPSKTTAANVEIAQDTFDRDEVGPQAESMEAAPLELETAEGNALLHVRFAREAQVEPTVKTVIEERDVLLRDDGLESDERAGDGTYSAIAFIDFNALAENQERVAQVNAAPPPEDAATDEPSDTTTDRAGSLSQSAPAGSSFSSSATDGTADEPLASDEAVLMPSFQNGRDRQGTKVVPKIDFRNLKPGQFVPLFPLATYHSVNAKKSLVITDVSVVENWERTFNPCNNAGTPMGAWTFGRLMTDMANQPMTGIQPSNFVRQWLNKWMADQTTANGWTAAKRLQMQQLVIDPWVAASGGPTQPLNLSIAPFRLLAIVNRVDLRKGSYGGGNAGEGRFVFGIMDMRKTGGIDPYTNQPTAACTPTQFTVILEYGIDRKGCPAVKDWGTQWFNLKYHGLGSGSYNKALQAITDQFTKANAAPTKPNGSALNQLRTNEIAIRNVAPDNFWQLREFRLPQGNGLLFEANAKQTPHESRRNTGLTAGYINSNQAAILNDTYIVPEFLPGMIPFLTNASDVPGLPLATPTATPTPAPVFWSDGPGAPIVNRQARHLFSLNTCSACHHGETFTSFTHIKPAPFGTPAGLSGFMTGINVVDPADNTPTRNFNEFKRRRIDLDALVHTKCFLKMLNAPPPSVH